MPYLFKLPDIVISWAKCGQILAMFSLLFATRELKPREAKQSAKCLSEKVVELGFQQQFLPQVRLRPVSQLPFPGGEGQAQVQEMGENNVDYYFKCNVVSCPFLEGCVF